LYGRGLLLAGATGTKIIFRKLYAILVCRASGTKATAMKKEFYIQIPEPCHEDWDKMTPVQQGRYCQSCCKEVVDFTSMTDQEIIGFLSKPLGKACGNFSTDQLNRAITEPTTPAKKRIWAVMLSFLIPLFISTKSKAQRGKLAITNRAQQQPVKCATEIRGETIARVIPQTINIEGKIKDTSGNPVPFATVLISGTNHYALADSAGIYCLKNILRGDLTLSVSSIGFYSRDVRIPSAPSDISKNVTLDPQITKLPEVIVSSLPVISCRRIEKDIVLAPKVDTLQAITVESSYSGRMAGAYAVCRTRSIRKTIADTIADIFKPALIKVFPNPAREGGHVWVQINAASHYQLKLFNSQSQLVLQTSFTIAAKRQSYQMELPTTLSSGMYVINITDIKTKTQYTHKLIIQ
jgi:hypothetical protein